MITKTTSGFPGTRMPKNWLANSLWAFLMLVVSTSLTQSACAQEVAEAGSSSRQLRNEALQAIPYQQLNRPTREKISEILEKPSIYRRLPVTTINTDADHFRFLVRYPEVIVNIWQLMGVTKMTTQRTGPFTLDSDDGVGTISSLELVYGNDNLHIYYGTGTYEGPVLRKQLTGKCVLLLQSDYRTDASGETQAVNQLDVFLKVDNATLGWVAKTIQPIVGSTADHNFVESLKFVQRLNDTTVENGAGVQQMAERLDLDPDVKKKYQTVAGDVFQRSLQRRTVPAYIPANQATHQVPSRSTDYRPSPPPENRYQADPRSTSTVPTTTGPNSGFQSSLNRTSLNRTSLNRTSLNRTQLPPIVSQTEFSMARSNYDSRQDRYGYRAPSYQPQPTMMR